MNEEKRLTPERELLKLIEEPISQEGVSPLKARRRFFSLFSPAALKARLSFWQAKFKAGISLQRLLQLEIKNINWSLEVLIFILIFYLVASFLISMINLNKSSSLDFKLKKITASSLLPEASLLKAASSYLERARARDIFKMGLASLAEPQKAERVPISKIAEASQNLKLVGISWSEDPDVIIENTQEGKAYFLRRGQMINDFQVKAIFKDKVVLSYAGEEVELR